MRAGHSAGSALVAARRGWVRHPLDYWISPPRAPFLVRSPYSRRRARCDREALRLGGHGLRLPSDGGLDFIAERGLEGSDFLPGVSAEPITARQRGRGDLAALNSAEHRPMRYTVTLRSRLDCLHALMVPVVCRAKDIRRQGHDAEVL